MSEEHQIVGLARGEPLPEGRVGVCLRFPLSGTPSPRWSRGLTARLAVELTGRPAVGHLRLNQLVQGREIVLEGVESDEASHIAGAVERAVDAANVDCTDINPVDASESDAQTKAHALAREVGASQRRVDPDHPDGDLEA
jgi:hypothetical protein